MKNRKHNPLYTFLYLCILLLLLAVLVNIISLRILVSVDQNINLIEEASPETEKVENVVEESIEENAPCPEISEPEAIPIVQTDPISEIKPISCESKNCTDFNCMTDRYKSLIPIISQSDIDLVAAVVYQEANNQSFEGQQAVAEVILNRMLNDGFPNSISEIVYQKSNGYWQFSTAPLLASTTPNQTNYDAVMTALYGPQVLDSEDVVFFAQSPENNRIADHIGAHYFCREYVW